MTDNGTSFRSHRYAKALRRLAIKHIRIKPYTPKTNGKAERLVQTALREWAYAKAYETSEQRAADLPVWLHRYNWHRPARQLKLQHAHQPTRPLRGQPVEAPQLARRADCPSLQVSRSLLTEPRSNMLCEGSISRCVFGKNQLISESRKSP